LNQIHRGQFKSWVSKFSWQRAASVTVGWFEGRTGKTVKTAISGTPNCLNYCVIFAVHKQFTNVAIGRKIQPGGPHATRCQRFGDP
jgi:hypothetical protein